MATFIEKIRETQTQASSKIEEKKKQVMETRKDKLYEFLTSKYHAKIKRAIENAAKRGLSEKFINFEKDDFKANCEGLGYPSDVQRLWLKEVILNKDENKYLPIDETTSTREHMHGINFDIWNNAKFTTRFYW